MATTQIADVVVPEIFSPYASFRTTELSALIQSGAVAVSPELSAKLAGGGSTFEIPFWHDLAQDEENVSSDEDAGVNDSVPKKITAGSEVQRRLSRNQSWSAANLAAELAGDDPMDEIATKVGTYWSLRLQKAFIAVMNGVFADNAAVPGGTDQHTQDDLTVDISGAYSAGTTDISGSAFIDALLTMGDAMESLSIMAMHSIPYAKLLKNNDIVTIRSSDETTVIPTFRGRRVVVLDGMPASGGTYETWLFGPGAVQFGQALPDRATVVAYDEAAGNGAGLEVLHNRVTWALHPKGHAFIGSPASNGGPTNAELANAGSWTRRYTERKAIQIARLITTEHA